jgi:methyl-accepting chemotaxis protein
MARKRNPNYDQVQDNLQEAKEAFEEVKDLAEELKVKLAFLQQSTKPEMNKLQENLAILESQVEDLTENIQNISDITQKNKDL